MANAKHTEGVEALRGLLRYESARFLHSVWYMAGAKTYEGGKAWGAYRCSKADAMELKRRMLEIVSWIERVQLSATPECVDHQEQYG